jgi:LacI family gluconate utilization system Gnt-I transcriptional repressor
LLLTGFDRTESSRRMIEASNIPCVYMMELDSAAGVNCVGFSQLSAGKRGRAFALRGRKRWPISAQLDQRTLLRGEGFRKALQKAGR